MADLQTTAPAKAKAGAAKAAKQQPQRFRVSVPAADEAVLAWMDLQDNPSLSVRMLIRENIERNGYVDVINKPVAQLPKRGRPAGTEEETAEPADTAHAAAAPVLPVRQPAAAPTDLDLRQEERTAPELLGIALEDPTLAGTQSQQPAPQRDAAPDAAPVPSEPEQPSSGQLEVNDIFSTLR